MQSKCRNVFLAGYNTLKMPWKCTLKILSYRVWTLGINQILCLYHKINMGLLQYFSSWTISCGWSFKYKKKRYRLWKLRVFFRVVSGWSGYASSTVISPMSPQKKKTKNSKPRRDLLGLQSPHFGLPHNHGPTSVLPWSYFSPNLRPGSCQVGNATSTRGKASWRKTDSSTVRG